MDEFGGVGAYGVDAQDGVAFLVDEEFEHADFIAQELAAGDFFVASYAAFVGDFRGGEAFFGPADHGDFGDGVDAVGEEFIEGFAGLTEGVAGGDAALFHAGAGEGGEADDIADGVDAGGLSLIICINFYSAAVVGGDASSFKTESGNAALAADAIEEAVGFERFAGFEGCFDGAARRRAGRDGAIGQAHAFDFFAEAEGDTGLAEVVLEGFGDFGIDEFEEARATFDEGDFDAKKGEHGGVFGADDAATYDDYGARDGCEAQDFITGEDVSAVEFDVAWAGRRAANRDDDFGSGDLGGGA